jgi:signal transduction histidine kinase
MSHEVRTPLHAILSMSRMLLEARQRSQSVNTQELEDLTQIIKSSETLEALVNDILFISKMQTSGFELNNSAFDVCELIEDIAALLALRWSAKNVEAVTDLRVPEFSYEVSFCCVAHRWGHIALDILRCASTPPNSHQSVDQCDEVYGPRQCATLRLAGRAAPG